MTAKVSWKIKDSACLLVENWYSRMMTFSPPVAKPHEALIFATKYIHAAN
jgi:hypothetical protein